MTEQEKQEIILAVLNGLKVHSMTIDQLTPATVVGPEDNFELGGGKRVSYAILLNSLTEDLQSLIKTLNGYIALDSIDELPQSKTNYGYLIGSLLYVWVGEGGDAVEGKYKSVPFAGSKGEDGNGIAEIRVSESSVSGGSNIVTVVLDNGNETTFSVKNGVKGDSGVNLGQIVLSQEKGQGTDVVMSQNSVTLSFQELESKIKAKIGFTETAINLLEAILRSAVTTEDQSSNIDSFIEELSSSSVKAPIITTDETTVTITTSTEGASIRYTIDGTQPSIEHGTLYTAPFKPKKSCVVKAIAYKDGESSLVKSKEFIYTIDYIVFNDPEVERIMLANFDNDGDGKIKLAEAADITDIGTLFSNNNVITEFEELVMFENLKTLAFKAFENCTNLKRIDISNIDKFNVGTQFMSAGIEEIVFNDNVTDIASSVVRNCQSMKRIVLGSSVETIGNLWASGNTATTLICKATTPPSADWSLFNGFNPTNIYVPAESVDAYKADANWGKKASIISAIEE